MTKLGAVFWIGLVLASMFTTFKVKYAVQEIDDELVRVRRHAIAEQQEIRVLTAEWTYLNQPERLGAMNQTFLQLGPMTARQLQYRIEDIPWRAPAPAPAPTPPEPEMLVAAAPPPVTPATSGPPAATRSAATPATAPLPAATMANATMAAAPPAVPSPAATLGRAASALVAVPTAHAATPADAASPLQLAKAAPESLDALIAQIADTR